MVQSRADKPNALHELGYKIFLDRYAQKDMTRVTLTIGDTVIVVVNPKTGQREIGEVTQINLPEVTVKLNDGEIVTRDIEHVDKPIETTPEAMMDRVARGIAEVEKNDSLRKSWSKNFRWLLDDWKFVPGGRILTAAGTDQDLTYYNCMPPEQEILTHDGYKPLAEVHVGDYVVTHRNRLRKVLHKFERETQETLYIIKPKKLGYDELRLTGEHKIMIIRDEWVNTHRSRDGLRLAHEPAWVPAQDVKPGDYVAVAHDGTIKPLTSLKISDYIGVDALHEDYAPDAIVSAHSAYEVVGGQLQKITQHADGSIVTGKRPQPMPDELTIDEDLAYLFGRWLGDGCITHRTGTDIPSGIKIVFNVDELKEAETLARIIEAKFTITPSIKLSSSGTWYDLWVNAMPIGEFFKNFLGVYSYSKMIPDTLMHLPDNLTHALLKGLFQADGYVSGSYIGMLLSNRTLATQVHQLLLRLGYFFSVKEDTHKNSRHPAYRLTASASEAQALFHDFFNVTTPERGHDLKAYLDYDGLRWVRIDDITTQDYHGTVLDIEVEEDHSFVSAGVVVSNCYVIPSPQDSREGIMQTLTNMTEIMSRGGGVGINLSTLRPRHAYVKGVNGRSSGSVSWGALYSFVTGLIEQGGCFGADERIATDKGLIPAQELVERIEAGETFQAMTHKGLRPIVAKFRNGVKPLYEVETKRGFRVQITQDHKVAVLMDGKVTTMPLKYLQEGDEILLLLGEGIESDYVQLAPLHYERSVMSTTLNTEVTFPEHLNEDLAYLLGYAYGDGFVEIARKVNWQAPKGLKLATADAHPTIRERLAKIVQDQFNLEPIINDGDGAVKNISIYSRMLMEWLIQHGLLKPKADAIRVPEAIFRSPSSVMLAFIAGYFDADGCNRGRKDGYGFDSIARDMLADIQQLLASNGIMSHITQQERQEGWQTIYRLVISGATFKRRFSELIPAEKISEDNGVRDMYNTYPAEVWTQLGARAKYRQRIYDGVSERISHVQLEKIHTRLAHAEETLHAQNLRELMNVMPDTITTITPLGDAEVYDFEVEDVHLLSGSGVYTSNSRRGALMLILNDWHPDVFDFITSKRQAGNITNANISVGVSDKLMEAVENDADWQLMFPDTSDPDYDTLWDGDIDTWIATGRKVINYKTVKAREVWDAIIESAWASAEPGVWFRERSNKMANSWYFNPLVSTNPCGEQPLGAWSVCNLGALNLAKFYDADNHDVAWDELDKAVRYATRFLDNVIDTTPYFFEENRDMQLGERRVGLGTMGIAELMLSLGIRYGSDESVDFIDKVYKAIAVSAYETSIELAQEKGAFPQFDGEKLIESGFMQQMPDHIRQGVLDKGLRNVTLLTQAPTGTTGTMVNTSTGIEPFFSWVYYRKSRLGLHEEQVPIVAEYYANHPDATELPDYFVTAMDLSPDEHVKVQGAFQKWIDSAISKTCNVPNEYTVEQVSDLYKYMYELGCKGGTIYRDGSRDEQVLMLKGDERAEKEMDQLKAKELEEKIEQLNTPHRVYPRPTMLTGATISFNTPFGKSYITMNSDEDGNPFEAFITVGKAGSDVQADAEALGRMISLSLRTTAPHNRKEMLRLIAEQLSNIGGSRSVGFGPNRVLSLPDAVAQAVMQHYFGQEEHPRQMALPLNGVNHQIPSAQPATSVQPGQTAQPTQTIQYSNADMCPECGTISFIRAEGCRKCLTCGYSEC